MRAYSLDLRERIVAAVKNGMTKVEVAKQFGVSRSSLYSYLKRSKENNLTADSPPGRPRKLSQEQEQKLIEYIKTKNDLSLEEYAEHVAKEHDIKLAISTLHLYCQRAGITRKSSLEQEVLSRY